MLIAEVVDRALDKLTAGLAQRTTIRGIRVVSGVTLKWKCPCCDASGSFVGDIELTRSCLISFVQRHQACVGAADTIPP